MSMPESKREHEAVNRNASPLEKISQSDRLKILLAAFEQNWELARHLSAERYWLLSFYAISVSAAFYTLPSVLAQKPILSVFLAFLFVLTFSIYLSFIKINAAQRNALVSIEWVSEEMGLSKTKLCEGRKEEICDAWVPLRLTLPISVHKWPYTHFPRIMCAGIVGALVTLALYDITFICALVLALVSFIVTLVLLTYVEHKMSSKAEKIINSRKPKDHFLNSTGKPKPQ